MSAQDQFNQWLNKVVNEETPSSKIIAYNFGILQWVTGYAEGYCLYLVGSEQYEEDNDDWACNEDFVPHEKYFELPDKEFPGLTWEVALEKTIELLRSYMLTEKFENSFLNKSVAITTGFDSGELVKVK